MHAKTFAKFGTGFLHLVWRSNIEVSLFGRLYYSIQTFHLMNRKYVGLVLAALQDEAYRLNELTVKEGRM